MSPSITSVSHNVAIHFLQYLTLQEYLTLISTCKYLMTMGESVYLWTKWSQAHNLEFAWDCERFTNSRRDSFRRGLMYQRRFSDTSKLVTCQNLQVFARLKPLDPTSNRSPAMYAYDDHHVAVTELDGPPTLHRFHRVLGASSTNDEVFNSCAYDAFTTVLAGLSAAIFVYGQTGSGKTHTMLGPAGCTFRNDDPTNGLIPRMFYELLRVEESERAAQKIESFEFSLMCVEVYRERMFNLLNKHEKAELAHALDGSYILPSSLAHVVNGEDDFVRLMRTIDRAKHTASTNMNNRSSRGHTVYALKLRQTSAGRNIQSTLYLVDLAGNERLKRSKATGEQLLETMSINRSLSDLARCLRAVVNKSRHVPFRDSLLTMIMQPALQGLTRTTLVVTLSTSSDDYRESLSTLRFAHSASSVQMVYRAPMAAMDAVAQEILRLEAALDRLLAVIEEIQKEKVRQRCLSGNIGREPLLVESEELLMHFDLARKYQNRLAVLRDM